MIVMEFAGFRLDTIDLSLWRRGNVGRLCVPRPLTREEFFPVPCSALLVAIELGYRISRGHSSSAGDPGTTRRVCAASCGPGGLLQQ
jgi:hypothetical protein